MASNLYFDSISLSEIDWDDHRFRVSTSEPTGALVDSIERLGVLTPIVVKRNKKRFYIIISGFKRAAVCRQVGAQQITARILDPQTPLADCVDIAITDNVQLRTLNFVEQSRVIQLLEQVYPNPEKICKAAQCLSLPLNSGMLEKLRAVSRMNELFQNALIDGDIALPVALQLNEMTDKKSADRIATIIIDMGLGLNRQRELIEWIIAISRRDNIPAEIVIENDELQEIFNSPETDKKQKSIQTREYLKKRRYPRISETERRYQQSVNSLRLQKGVRLIPPVNFEGMTYALKIDFKNHRELVSRFQKLQEVIHSSVLKTLWEDSTSD